MNVFRFFALPILIIALAMLFSGCGGGGCEAGEPLYKDQKYDCQIQNAPSTPASGPR